MTIFYKIVLRLTPLPCTDQTLFNDYILQDRFTDNSTREQQILVSTEHEVRLSHQQGQTAPGKSQVFRAQRHRRQVNAHKEMTSMDY